MSVDVFGDLARARAPATFGIDTVAVKLQMGEMRPVAVHRPHAVERRRHVARDTEIVAVNVRGMRQAQLIGGADQRFENRTRVTRLDPTGVSSSTRPRRPCFHSSMPPGFTTLMA